MGYRMMKNVYLKKRCRHKKITKSTYINKGKIFLGLFYNKYHYLHHKHLVLFFSLPHDSLLNLISHSSCHHSINAPEAVFILVAMEALWSFQSKERYENTKWLMETLWGDGVAKLVERLTRDTKNLGFKPRPHQEHKKTLRVFPSQKCCADSLSVCPTPMCVHTHTNDHIRMLKIL